MARVYTYSARLEILIFTEVGMCRQMLLQNSNMKFNETPFGKSRCDTWGRTDRIGEASSRFLELFSEGTHKRVSNFIHKINLLSAKLNRSD